MKILDILADIIMGKKEVHEEEDNYQPGWLDAMEKDHCGED